MVRRVLSSLFLVNLILATSGCSVFKASPTDLSGFLPKGELLVEARERAPFHGYWVFEPNQYYAIRQTKRKVHVAPVDITYVEKLYRASSGSEKKKQARIQESQELARYFAERIRLALQNRQEINVVFVDQPGEGVLSINLALVQVVPTNPGVNFVGTAAGFLVPGGGLIKFAGEGSVAMEGFVSEHTPEALYEQYKDREGQKSSPFSFKDYQRYAHIRVAIDEWSEQIAELLSTPPDHQVEDRDLVTLNPL